MKSEAVRYSMLWLLLGASASHGAILFDVTLDTSALIGHPAGPFSLDFQLIDGSGGGDANNTVVISDFDFDGGGWAGPVSVSLTDSAFFTDFTEAFNVGTGLSFRVSVTTAVDAGATPDRFSFALLDNGGFEIPTRGLADEFLGVDLNSPYPLIEAYSSDLARTGIGIAAPTVTIVPEPAFVALLAGLVLVGFAGCRRLRPSRA